MSAIDSSRRKPALAAGWLVFAGINALLMYQFPGAETIPYHLIWASFALLYGLVEWSRATTVVVFCGITIVTGVPLVEHASEGFIGWEESSEVVLMAVIAGLLVWHVNRSFAARHRIDHLRETERARAYNRELATRFGSHELRTRLTIARGMTDLIHGQTQDERTRDDAGLALAELDKATVLATNLMTLVRIDAEPALESVDVDALIATIMRRWEVHIDRNWIVSATAGHVRGDAERLEAAVDSLIENAVKFTGTHGSIRVGAHGEGPEIVIWVQDDGAGIPLGEIGRVTELFRVSSNAGERAGSGLGLAIVRAVVEAHGGALDVQSSLGHGTRIAMRIPRGDTRRNAPGDTIETVTEQTLPGPESMLPLGGELADR